MSEFLDKLKKAVDEGEFNSEAAKKINEIEKRSMEIDPNEAEKLLEKRLEESGAKIITEDEVVAKNIDYDKKLEQLKYIDGLNKQIATLRDMENMVLLSIQDMLQYVKTVDENFNFDKENEENNKKLNDEIQRIKDRFGSLT